MKSSGSNSSKKYCSRQQTEHHHSYHLIIVRQSTQTRCDDLKRREILLWKKWNIFSSSAKNNILGEIAIFG